VAASAAGPLAAAWWHNRHTALRHALVWAIAAWGAWTLTAVLEAADGRQLAWRYLALCLTGCAGVAVLGARRPGVGAWNFVVAGLLVVLLRPLWERPGEFRIETPPRIFLAVVLAVPLINYLPTRLAPAALLLAAGCVLEALPMLGWPMDGYAEGVGAGIVGVAAWVGWVAVRRSGVGTFDRLWLGYRDRYGLLWGHRIREQFNHAARNAGRPVTLTWTGLRPADAESPETLATLRAVLMRFAERTDDVSV
jgi:hypothetical protein